MRNYKKHGGRLISLRNSELFVHRYFLFFCTCEWYVLNIAKDPKTNNIKATLYICISLSMVYMKEKTQKTLSKTL